MPEVSVVVPTYNHRDTVLLALKSVWAQTFTDFEVIVVNDGSPDDTADLLLPLAESGKIRYLEQANAGQAAARNVGIAEARGEFIALLDDDDLWPPDKLEWQVVALRQSPEAALVYGKPLCINEAGETVAPVDARGEPLVWPWTGPSGDVHQALAEGNRIVSPGQCLIRGSSLSALGEPAFDASLWGCDDWDLWLRLAENGPFLFVDRPALLYRFHRANASRDGFRLNVNNLALYRKHLHRNKHRPERVRYLRAAFDAFRRPLPGWWIAQALEDGARGHLRSAGTKLAQTLRLGPAFWLRREVVRFLWEAWRRRRRLGAAGERVTIGKTQAR